MTRLLRAELLRLRSRRLTWVALAAVLLVMVLAQLAVGSSVRPLTEAERAEGRVAFEQAQREYEENREQYERSAEECVTQGGGTREQCEFVPAIEDYVPRSVSTFAEAGEVVILVTVSFTGLALLLLAASMIGAEYSSGSLANWLTFVPGRGRVFAAKLLALVLVAAVATAVLTALGLAVTALIARGYGVPLTGLRTLAATSGRGVLVGVAAVAVGFGLALLTRHTIAAAGVVLGYLILSSVLAFVWFTVPALAHVQRYLPENNLQALLLGKHTYETYTPVAQPDGSFSENAVEHVISLTQGSIYWGVLVVGLTALAYLVFRRRDLT